LAKPEINLGLDIFVGIRFVAKYVLQSRYIGSIGLGHLQHPYRSWHGFNVSI
jgi:hypothetical protein